jgi:hypothetical protein
MKTSYVKEKSTGKILTSSDGQDETNPVHIAAVESFVTSRGWNLADYEIGFADEQVVKSMIDASVTALETWARDMRAFPMSREIEEHITAKHGGIADSDKQQLIYDAKIARLAEKPL